MANTSDFLDGSDGKESACNMGDPGSIPGSGRYPGEGSGNLLQYSCLKNPMDKGAWWAIVHGITKSQIWLNNFTFTFKLFCSSALLIFSPLGKGGDHHFAHCLVSKEYVCSVGHPGVIPRSGRSPGEGDGNPLQYSCLEKPMDKGAWWAIVHRISKSQTQLSD